MKLAFKPSTLRNQLAINCDNDPAIDILFKEIGDIFVGHCGWIRDDLWLRDDEDEGKNRKKERKELN